MATVNKVILVGNLGRDPETRYAPNGEAVSNITIATTDYWKDRTSGERKERIEWHRISFFGRLAEVVGMHLRKGASVYIEGSLRTRKYQDKDGQDKFITEVRGDTMQMLSKPGTPAGSADGLPARTPQPAKAPETWDNMDDDLPF